MIEKKIEKSIMIPTCLAVMLTLIIFAPLAVGEEKTTERPQNREFSASREVTYQNHGFVQRVGEDEIVVDDHLLKFAGSVVYHAPERGGLVSKNIKEGSQIGFTLNDKNEVTDIWILKGK